jgi:lipid-binding SYLF domain-containing protein
MNMKTSYFRNAAFISAGLMGLLVLNACSTAPSTAQGKSDLRGSSVDALATAQQNDPTLRDFVGAAAGYAVFPTVGKGAAGIGGAYGKGDVYQDGRVVGYCDMTQGTIGLQLGGQAYTEILVFESPIDLQRFKDGNFAFNAQTTAVALKSGAGANAQFVDGIAVFTMDESGLMFEASVGGQKFSYQDRKI